MRYLDQSTRDEAKEAHRNGIPLDRIAGYLGISVAELRAVLGLPSLRPVPVSDEPDLWRVPELEGLI